MILILIDAILEIENHVDSISAKNPEHEYVTWGYVRLLYEHLQNKIISYL
jgi:hypothetical protein